MNADELLEAVEEHADEFAEVIVENSDRVVAREEFEKERAVRRRIETERNELQERVEELEDRVDDDQHQLKDIEMWRNAMSTWKDETSETIWELEDQLEAIEASSSSDLTDRTDDDIAGMLPIEKLTQLPESVAKEQLDTPQSRNLYRARFLWKNFEDYSQVVGSGDSQKLRITSSEMMRVLSASEDGNSGIESKTTERVMKRIVDWTHEIAEIRRTQDGQRALYLSEDWTTQRDEALEKHGENEEQHDDADTVVSGRR